MSCDKHTPAAYTNADTTASSLHLAKPGVLRVHCLASNQVAAVYLYHPGYMP
jgi:hypothetical protein